MGLVWEKWSRPTVAKNYWAGTGWVVFHRWGTDVCDDWQTAIDSANVYARLAAGFGAK